MRKWPEETKTRSSVRAFSISILIAVKWFPVKKANNIHRIINHSIKWWHRRKSSARWKLHVPHMHAMTKHLKCSLTIFLDRSFPVWVNMQTQLCMCLCEVYLFQKPIECVRWFIRNRLHQSRYFPLGKMCINWFLTSHALISQPHEINDLWFIFTIAPVDLHPDAHSTANQNWMLVGFPSFFCCFPWSAFIRDLIMTLPHSYILLMTKNDSKRKKTPSHNSDKH